MYAFVCLRLCYGYVQGIFVICTVVCLPILMPTFSYFLFAAFLTPLRRCRLAPTPGRLLLGSGARLPFAYAVALLWRHNVYSC